MGRYVTKMICIQFIILIILCMINHTMDDFVNFPLYWGHIGNRRLSCVCVRGIVWLSKQSQFNELLIFWDIFLCING